MPGRAVSSLNDGRLLADRGGGPGKRHDVIVDITFHQVSGRNALLPLGFAYQGGKATFVLSRA